MDIRGFEVVSQFEDKDIALPRRKTTESAGYDIECAEAITIAPGEMKLVATGLKAFMNYDEYLAIHIRSSMAIKRHLMLVNSTGIIDSDYFYSDNEGHMFSKITNDTNEEKTIDIAQGEGFMQGIFVEYGITVDDDVTDVRNGGFGSTTK